MHVRFGEHFQAGGIANVQAGTAITIRELQDKIKEQEDKVATLEEVVARLMDEIENLKNGSE
ncbi:MAG: hypothetical protein IJT97_10185 [Bacteroidaceae bacterium]|nr:hypothetical protein [Bacteroidaceae bacterium]